ncbi:thioredoxin-disulfide reductase [Candidatus Micrarchaeota archaeon]|nr:thioredoxin-disulfide reductase [Candidatus Micrarchaeota archaeon]MBD3418426.1 thioredoxin-disulfide reductase [Candidatus Micrarchaeota archaeon]
MERYDSIILGAGPAGLAAALYSARAGKKILVLDKGTPGGQIYLSSLVENYPGVKSTDGQKLVETMVEQAKSFGAEIKPFAEVTEADLKNKTLKTKEGTEYNAESIIIATGNRWRKLNVPGEEEFVGRGVSYCATCDGPFFKGQEVAVIGGGNTAVEEAMHLTNFASKVFVVHRRDQLRAEKYLQEKAFKNEKMEFIWDSEVKSINGEGKVESITLKNKKTGEETSLGVGGAFIFIGMLPNSELFKGQLETDERGYIITNEKMQTSIPGVYAAGDVRSSPVKQITTATADGTVASIVSCGGH